MNRFFAAIVAFMALVAVRDAVAVAAASCPASVDPALITNYRQVKPGLATAGRITPEGLGQLKALGFKTVLNLRTEQEGAKEEEAAVKAQGLAYVWVPVTPASLSLEDVQRVEKVLDDPAAAPVLFHCASANRVGAVWAVIQARRGKALEAALQEGTEIGLRPGPMTAAVERLVAAGAISK